MDRKEPAPCATGYYTACVSCYVLSPISSTPLPQKLTSKQRTSSTTIATSLPTTPWTTTARVTKAELEALKVYVAPIAGLPALQPGWHTTSSLALETTKRSPALTTHNLYKRVTFTVRAADKIISVDFPSAADGICK